MRQHQEGSFVEWYGVVQTITTGDMQDLCYHYKWGYWFHIELGAPL